MSKSSKRIVNNELRILIIATLVFVFLVPVGFLVITTVQDEHDQEDFQTEVDEVAPESENDETIIEDEGSATTDDEDAAITDGEETSSSEEDTTSEDDGTTDTTEGENSEENTSSGE